MRMAERYKGPSIVPSIVAGILGPPNQGPSHPFKHDKKETCPFSLNSKDSLRSSSLIECHEGSTSQTSLFNASIGRARITRSPNLSGKERTYII